MNFETKSKEYKTHNLIEGVRMMEGEGWFTKQIVGPYTYSSKQYTGDYHDRMVVIFVREVENDG